MQLIKLLWEMKEEEFNEIIKDLPYLSRFVLKTYYKKIQKLKEQLTHSIFQLQ